MDVARLILVARRLKRGRCASSSKRSRASTVRTKTSATHVAAVEEQKPAKLDAFDAKHTGAPSPDHRGMVSSDDDDDDATQLQSPGIDPATGDPLPPMPAAFLSPRKA